MPLRAILLTLTGLFTLAVIFVVVVAILAFTGGPNLDAECGDREIDVSGQTSVAFDGKWDAFDAQVGSGQRSTVSFDEAELTQRAQAFLLDEAIDELQEITVCLFADGTAEVKGKVDVPGLPDLSAKIRGRITLTGGVPVFVIDDFDVGNTGFLVDLFGAEGEVEDGVNEALAKLSLKNAPYGVEIAAGTATVSGG
jgi:hypothetical protein